MKTIKWWAPWFKLKMNTRTSLAKSALTALHQHVGCTLHGWCPTTLSVYYMLKLFICSFLFLFLSLCQAWFDKKCQGKWGKRGEGVRKRSKWVIYMINQSLLSFADGMSSVVPQKCFNVWAFGKMRPNKISNFWWLFQKFLFKKSQFIQKAPECWAGV